MRQLISAAALMLVLGLGMPVQAQTILPSRSGASLTNSFHPFRNLLFPKQQGVSNLPAPGLFPSTHFANFKAAPFVPANGNALWVPTNNRPN